MNPSEFYFTYTNSTGASVFLLLLFLLLVVVSVVLTITAFTRNFYGTKSKKVFYAKIASATILILFAFGILGTGVLDGRDKVSVCVEIDREMVDAGFSGVYESDDLVIGVFTKDADNDANTLLISEVLNEGEH